MTIREPSCRQRRNRRGNEAMDPIQRPTTMSMSTRSPRWVVRRTRMMVEFLRRRRASRRGARRPVGPHGETGEEQQCTQMQETARPQPGHGHRNRNVARTPSITTTSVEGPVHYMPCSSAITPTIASP